MAKGLDTLIHHLAGPARASRATDGHLLDCFIRRREEAAFAELLQRHGPMVWDVCRQILHDAHDAEDAFQATFLVLVRKAGSIRKHDSLRSWLYGVAYRVAVRAKAQSAKRRSHERQGVAMETLPASPDIDWRQIGPALHEELFRFPDKYRLPLLLCCLDRKTHEQAAKALSWPVGTVSTRLARARALLQARLTRRGLTLSAATWATLLSESAAPAALPTMLVHSTIKAALLVAAGKAAAAGAISAPVAALTEGVVHAMFITKMRIAAAVVLVVALLSGAGVVTYHTVAGGQCVGPEPRGAEPAAKNPRNKAAEQKPELTKQAPWGEPVEGVQCRLKADKNVWKTGEVLTFKAEVRNLGKLQVLLAGVQELCELEIDAKTYRWLGPINVSIGRFFPGDHFKDISVSLVKEWKQEAGGSSNLTPGKHKIRVVFVGEPEDTKNGKGVRAVSNAVEIEIVAADAPPKETDEAKTDLEKLQGNWKIISEKWLGKASHKYEKLVFAGNKLKLKWGNDGQETELSYQLNTAKKPKEIDLEPTGSGYDREGIYELDADQLKLCLRITSKDEVGKARPKDFTTKAGELVHLFVLQREPPVKEPDWGEAVEGLQCRLWPSQKQGEAIWFPMEFRNSGKRKFTLMVGTRLCDLELDGQEYRDALIFPNSGISLSPGNSFKGFSLRVGPLNCLWESKQDKKALNWAKLPIGKHKVRAILLATDAADKGKLVRAFSNTVEIEIAAAAASGKENEKAKKEDALPRGLCVALGPGSAGAVPKGWNFVSRSGPKLIGMPGSS